jgi:hypothetical protein
MLFEHEFVDHWKIAGRGLEAMLPKDGTPFTNAGITVRCLLSDMFGTMYL